MLMISLNLNAQTQMPNAGFELWSATLPNNRPTNYYTVDTMGMHSCYKTTDKYSGTYAMKLRSLDTTIIFYNVKLPGLATLGKLNINTTTFYGGIPFTDMPTNFRCYFKYLPNGIDTMMMAVYFWHYDDVLHKKDTLGGFVLDTSATISTYTYLDIPIEWNSNYTETPDSMNIILLASYTVKNHTYAYFDEFSFYYNTTGMVQSLDDVLSEVYPNPAQGTINVGNSEATELYLYSSAGKLICKQFAADRDHQLDVSGLPRGVYILKTWNEREVRTSKIVLN